MKSIMFAAQAIETGYRDCVVAGGMESMSNIPHYVSGMRAGLPLGDGKIVDGLVYDGLWDPYDDQHMGNCAEVCASTYGFSREDQDAYAMMSYERAAASWAAGVFANEIVPVAVPQRRGDAKIVDTDEEFSNMKVEKIPTLRPAFQKDGTVTAANASSINDGATATIVMSRARAEELGVKPLAVIRGFADAAKAPVEFTTAPAAAVPLAYAMAGITESDVDYHEINEAFSVVALANAQLLNVDIERVNVHGGAVALGHPIGSSGARIVTTLLSTLQQSDASIGVASICNGGGGASAIVIERE